MFDEYPVYYNNIEVGSVQLKKLGLYICFSGLLQMPHKSVWRAICNFDNRSVDLGICLFDGKHYIIRKQIPEKYLTGSNYKFEVMNMSLKKPQQKDVPDSSVELMNTEPDEKSFPFFGGDHVL